MFTWHRYVAVWQTPVVFFCVVIFCMIWCIDLQCCACWGCPNPHSRQCLKAVLLVSLLFAILALSQIIVGASWMCCAALAVSLVILSVYQHWGYCQHHCNGPSMIWHLLMRELYWHALLKDHTVLPTPMCLSMNGMNHTRPVFFPSQCWCWFTDPGVMEDGVDTGITMVNK